MPEPLLEFISAFILGLVTPLTAVCIISLYPGFLVFLSNSVQAQRGRGNIMPLFGFLVSLGVISFMFLLGLIFTTILRVSLMSVVGMVSPPAFFVLGVISIILILDINVGKFFPSFHAPMLKNPFHSAFAFGFFFGAIVIPCNPGFIAVLFAQTTTIADFGINMLRFLGFGFGISTPLFLFSLVSTKAGSGIINFLTGYRRKINLVSGLIMLAISLYYLVFIFKVF